MELEFDPLKDDLNERGISFERFADMDLTTAVALDDTRSNYGERRVRVFGLIDDRLHVAVVTYRRETVRVISLRPSEGMRKKPSRPDADNPEWTQQDFRDARPALELLPGEVVDAVRRYRGQRGPQKAPTKELISIRVDRDVVAAYRSSGTGWQVRANEALRSYVMRERRDERGRRALRPLGGRTKTGRKRG